MEGEDLGKRNKIQKVDLLTFLFFCPFIFPPSHTHTHFTLFLFLFLQVLSHCERISDSGISQLIDSPCGEMLQVLELDNCPQVTDNTLEKLRYA